MGAWSEGNFDNDDASDWMWELESADDVSVLEEAFAAINQSPEHLETPDCSVAVAAAEVVAALREHPSSKLPDEAHAYVARVGKPPSRALVAAALAALKRIKTKSELQELWDKTPNRAKWHAAIEELEGRLK